LERVVRGMEGGRRAVAGAGCAAADVAVERGLAADWPDRRRRGARSARKTDGPVSSSFQDPPPLCYAEGDAGGTRCERASWQIGPLRRLAAQRSPTRGLAKGGDMGDQRPILNQLNLVVLDMEAAAAFYRRLGMEIEERGPDHRTATNAGALDFDL